MSFPSPSELRALHPLSSKQQLFIESARKQAIEITHRRDKRLALLIGPCSIHDLDMAFEYAYRLKKISKELENQFFIVMRFFCEKPRTQMAWKGLLHDPDLNGSGNLSKGLVLIRKGLLTIAELELPAAVEFLDPLAAPFFEDLVTWGVIGARTNASPLHRQLSSHLSFPIGFKNSIHGEIEPALFGILCAQTKQSYLSINDQGRIDLQTAEGNPHTHLVLRGSDQGPNYSSSSIQTALTLFEKFNVPPRFLIDCSHGNSGKNPLQQRVAFLSVLENYSLFSDHLMGLMLESHLEKGAQAIEHPLRYGVSITDPCLSWEETEQLLEEGSRSISSVQK